MEAILNSPRFLWLKENTGLIILLPTLIGGSWQMLELIRISPSYIRFFSISQLVPDGLLILSVLFIYFIFYSYFNDTKIFSKPVTEDRPINSMTVRRFSIVYIMFSSFLLLRWNILSEASNSYVYYIFFTLTILYSLWFFAWRARAANFWTRENRGWHLLSIVMHATITALATASLLDILHYSFILPEHSKNQEYIDCVVRNHNPRAKSIKILYYNNEYFFVKIIEAIPYEYKVEVIKFDDFTNAEACQGQTPK